MLTKFVPPIFAIKSLSSTFRSSHKACPTFRPTQKAPLLPLPDPLLHVCIRKTKRCDWYWKNIVKKEENKIMEIGGKYQIKENSSGYVS
jgi:hypothetical protein